MENLNGYTNLVSLYLQKNQINIMENLYHLKKLKKLYIGHNNIGVMEGLTNNNQLEELHIEKQYISEGTSLCFDPRSVLALSVSLNIFFQYATEYIALFLILMSFSICGI